MTLFEKLLRDERDRKESQLLNATTKEIIRQLKLLTSNSYAFMKVDVGGEELQFIFRVDEESELIIQNKFGHEIPGDLRRLVLLEVGKEV